VGRFFETQCISPKLGQVNFSWSNNDVRMVTELILFLVWNSEITNKLIMVNGNSNW